MSRFRYLSDDSWESPTSVDDTDADPNYDEPSTSKRPTIQRNVQTKKKQPVAATNVSQTVPASSSASDSEESDVSRDFEARMGGGKRQPQSRKLFLDAVEKEPYSFGVADLPTDFAWTEKRPKDRPDFFQPKEEPGSKFKGDELPVEIFLALHGPALELLFFSINETRRELIQKKKMKNCREVTPSEILRFHSILIYCQSVKISRWDSYWRKSSIFYNEFVSKQMSFKRFKQIKRCVRCYIPSQVKLEHSDDVDSPNYDPLFKISAMQNLLLTSYRKHRVPDRQVVVDEQMVKYKVCRTVHVFQHTLL